MKWERPSGALEGPGPLVRTTVGRDALVESLRAHPPRRILLIIRSFIGDAVMTTGAVHSVIARFPDAHITLETTTRAMGVFDNCPGIHARRVRFDRFEKLTSVMWLRTAPRFDLGIVLDNSKRRAKVARWGGIRRVVGVREADDESWLMASVRWEEGGHDLFDSLRGVLALLDADVDIRPRLYPDDSARGAAARVLATMTGRSTIGLFLDAGREAKRWPVERFLGLAARLERAGIPVVAVAGLGGEALLEPFKARRTPTLEILRHPLALGELIRGFGVYSSRTTADLRIWPMRSGRPRWSSTARRLRRGLPGTAIAIGSCTAASPAISTRGGVPAQQTGGCATGAA